VRLHFDNLDPKGEEKIYDNECSSNFELKIYSPFYRRAYCAHEHHAVESSKFTSVPKAVPQRIFSSSGGCKERKDEKKVKKSECPPQGKNIAGRGEYSWCVFDPKSALSAHSVQISDL